MQRQKKSDIAKDKLISKGWEEDCRKNIYIDEYQPAGTISDTVVYDGYEHCYIYTSSSQMYKRYQGHATIKRQAVILMKRKIPA